MVVQNNIQALNVWRNMRINSTDVMKHMSRLSSGFKINTAADDAAGLAISEKMRAQIRGLDQAERNAQDGISLVQTAEGALSEIDNMLQRMRELSVQACNDTNLDGDREKLDAEFQQLKDEIDEIAQRTEFNKKILLDGRYGNEVSATAAAMRAAGGITPLSGPGIMPAAAVVINTGALTDGMFGTGWSFNGGVLTITGSGNTYTIQGTGAVNAVDRIVADSGVTADIVLNNVNINTSTGSALDMRNATVNLFLAGTNTLNASSSYTGIRTSGGTLRIDGTGRLTAIGGDAGIGGLSGEDGGNITIAGGTVSVSGGSTGPGIGSGSFTPADKITTVNITGGNVLVKCGAGGAGIGTGYAGSDKCAVNISGGHVRVEHDSGVFGIGNGLFNSGDCAVSISGGYVEMDSVIIGGIHGKTSTHITGGTFVIDDPANIYSGVTNSAGQYFSGADTNFLYRVSVLPPEIGFSFSPEESVKYVVNGAGEYTWLTDPYPYNNGMYLYLPDEAAPGDRTNIDIYYNGKIYNGYTEVAQNHSAVWHLESVEDETVSPDPPSPPPDPINPPPGPPTPPAIPPGSGQRHKGGLWLQTGANAFQGMYVYIESIRATDLGIAGSRISTWRRAVTALNEVNSALTKVTAERSSLGAYQNRLEHTIKSLGVSSENLSNAEGRIRNADMAEEMMRFTKRNVLRQAAVSVLAQVNQLPQSVLQLLR